MRWVVIGFELAIGVALAALVISLIVWALIAVKERINAHTIQVVLAGVLVMVFSGAVLGFIGMISGVIHP